MRGLGFVWLLSLGDWEGGGLCRNSKLSPPQLQQAGTFKQADPSSLYLTEAEGAAQLKSFGNPSFNRGIWSGDMSHH